MRPERLLSRDLKGATILHHAAANGRTKVMDFVLADQQGHTREWNRSGGSGSGLSNKYDIYARFQLNQAICIILYFM